MIRFVAEVAGVTVLDRAFNRVEGDISDLRPIWPPVAAEIYQMIGEQFESEGAKGASGRWKALSPAYTRFKEIHYPGKPIMQATGDLYESLTDPEAPGAIYRPEKDGLTIGTTVPYARAHQRGNSRLPARPLVSPSEAQKRRIQKAIQVGLVQFTRRAGFEVEEKAA